MLIALAVALLSVPLFLQRSVRARTSNVKWHPLDIGVFFAWVVFAYGAFPLVGIALAQWNFGTLYDDRLWAALPETSAVARVGLMYLMFLVGFAISYGVGSKSAPKPIAHEQLARPTSRDVWIALTLLVLVNVTIQASRAALGIEAGEDYLATYLEYVGQPLLVRQLAGILASSEFAVTILVIVVVIARNPRWHGLVAVFVVAQIVAAFVVGHSRTEAAYGALAYVVARSIYDRRMRFSFILLAGGAGLLLFLIAGMLRQSRSASVDLSGLYLLQGGEFMSVFVNSLDLADRLQDLDLAVLRLGIYAVDILRFIPRQIVGDLKLDPATFYVSTFYPEYAEAGGGLAFGAIAESTVGFGPIEALIRGALIGLAYALIRNACLGRKFSVLRAFVYTWFVVLSYQAIRDTTFSVFARFVFQVGPILVALWATGALQRRPPSGHARAIQSPAARNGGTDPSHRALTIG
jgi:hypothetical protein